MGFVSHCISAGLNAANHEPLTAFDTSLRAVSLASRRLEKDTIYHLERLEIVEDWENVD